MPSPYSLGIHSQAFISANLERSTRFMVDDLGLRLVKRTVHPHDERIAVAHFGFADGGTDQIVTYYEWNPIFYEFPADGFVDQETTKASLDDPQAGSPHGRWGAGTNHHLALHTDSREQLLNWKRHLSDRGFHVTGPYFRNYFSAIYFNDPDGAIFEIATTEPGFGHDEAVLGSDYMKPPEEAVDRKERDIAAEVASEPHADISAEMALRGFHHNTSVSSDIEAVTDFFVNRVGVDLIKMTDYLDAADATHYYYSATQEPRPGHVLTYFGFPGYPAGRLGVGLSHHIALTARDEEALAEWRKALAGAEIEVGEIEDERYFSSVSFRDPDGHLYRIATPPYFTIDEAAGELGQKLCLPSELESRRGEIEESLRLRPAPTPRRTAAA
ncbi:MAG: hypothetical protein BGO11_10375 [Solirubrobacterales bacterium 70-9]|nr:MAG: hypothetical protein BGO11_10375 [Solirubrobacterales bacterium 70-9]